MNLIEQSVETIKIPTIAEMQYIEAAGRNCYDSQSKMNNTSYEQFLKNIVKSGHLSVIEHSMCMFKIVTSRAMMAELTRHRLCAFSIRSQRYVDESNLNIIMPFAFNAMDDTTKEIMIAAYNQAECAYKKLLDTTSKQIARGVLPEDTATIIYMSCNLRELFHIIKLRTTKGAHPQMRALINGLRLQLPVFLQQLYTIYERNN